MVVFGPDPDFLFKFVISHDLSLGILLKTQESKAYGDHLSILSKIELTSTQKLGTKSNFQVF